MEYKNKKIILSDADCENIIKLYETDQTEDKMYLEYAMELMFHQNNLPEHLFMRKKKQFQSKNRKYRNLIKNLNDEANAMIRFFEMCQKGTSDLAEAIRSKIQAKAILMIILTVTCFLALKLFQLDLVGISILKSIYKGIVLYFGVSIGFNLLLIKSYEAE